MLSSSFTGLAYTNPSNGQHKRTRRFIAIFLFSIASRFKNEEGSCYFLVVPCANPSNGQHKRGRRFIAIIFLFSVASRFKNEEGSCYRLVVPCANPSDRQHKRGRRFIAMFLFSVASRFKNEEGSCYLVSSVPCANPSDRQHKRGRRFITMFLLSVASRFKNEEGSCYAFRVMSYCTARILEGLYDLTSVESNRLVATRFESIRQIFLPPCAFSSPELRSFCPAPRIEAHLFVTCPPVSRFSLN